MKYHPLPLTRRWLEDYRRWPSENAPKPPAKPLGSPPDLQEFIREHGDWCRLPPDYFDHYPPEERERHWENVCANGAYSVITPEEWAKWDRLNAEWRAHRPGR